MEIKDILKPGVENAICGRELAEMLNCDRRTIGAQIERERLKGAPICANPHAGYYLADKSRDLQEYIQRLSSRATKMLLIAKALRTTVLEMPDYDAEQLTIEKNIIENE